MRENARRIGGDPGTVSRELRRNAATRGDTREYRASVAQWKADMAAKRPKIAKLVANPRLHEYVQERLAGQVSLPDGIAVLGPRPPRFTGRNTPHRKDRPWSLAWSPEQIANRIKLDSPDDESMRISHEAIYQSLYIQGRGALKRRDHGDYRRFSPAAAATPSSSSKPKCSAIRFNVCCCRSLQALC
ncbi:hypothetical protein GCM10027055_26260 [Janibacter alkaliphilus]